MDILEDHPFVILVSSFILSVLMLYLLGKDVITVSIWGLGSIILSIILSVCIKVGTQIKRDYTHSVWVFHYRMPSLHTAVAYAGLLTLVGASGFYPPFMAVLVTLGPYAAISRMRHHLLGEVVVGAVTGCLSCMVAFLIV
jgi:hypothetical protein